MPKYDAGEGIEGVTDEQGRFRYLKGERVRFYVHNLFIGEATPVAKGDQQVVTPIELTQSSEVDDPKVVKLTQFLMGVDLDGDPTNGIQVIPTVLQRWITIPHCGRLMRRHLLNP